MQLRTILVRTRYQYNIRFEQYTNFNANLHTISRVIDLAHDPLYVRIKVTKAYKIILHH